MISYSLERTSFLAVAMHISFMCRCASICMNVSCIFICTCTPMGSACPTCAGKEGRLWTTSARVLSSKAQKKTLFCHGSCPLKHHMPPEVRSALTGLSFYKSLETWLRQWAQGPNCGGDHSGSGQQIEKRPHLPPWSFLPIFYCLTIIFSIVMIIVITTLYF